MENQKRRKTRMPRLGLACPKGGLHRFRNTRKTKKKKKWLKKDNLDSQTQQSGGRCKSGHDPALRSVRRDSDDSSKEARLSICRGVVDWMPSTAIFASSQNSLGEYQDEELLRIWGSQGINRTRQCRSNSDARWIKARQDAFSHEPSIMTLYISFWTSLAVDLQVMAWDLIKPATNQINIWVSSVSSVSSNIGIRSWQERDLSN